MTFVLVAIPVILFVAWFVPWLLTPLPKWVPHRAPRPVPGLYIDIDGNQWERIDIDPGRRTELGWKSIAALVLANYLFHGGHGGQSGHSGHGGSGSFRT